MARQTSNEILILLDKNLRRLGTISPFSDKNAFWGERFKHQIADDSNSNDDIAGIDTFNKTDPNANSKMWGDEFDGLTMVKDAPMAKHLAIGNSIARYNEDIGKWIIYRIISTDESIDETTGRHLVSADGVNLAIWHLGKTIPPKHSINECNLQHALEWTMQGSGWDFENNATSGLFSNMEFDGTTTSQSFLQTILTTYDCEAQAYAHFDASGLIDDLILEITDHLGSEQPNKTVRYGSNMKSIHRKTVDTTLITKLYVYGPDGNSIEKVNNGRDFVTDAQANALYNNDTSTWLEGSITSDSIKQPSGLLRWGQRQLQLYNHPRINYEVGVSEDFNPKLGDEIKVIDTAMQPDLTVQARVIQKEESISDPYNNSVTLGEFATVKVVTPSFIKSLQDKYNSRAKALFEKAKEDSTASSISLITPLGRSWYNDDTNKTCIARLFIEGQNVTSYLTKNSFNWQYIQRDGSHNYAWENQHKDAGYKVDIQPPFVGTLLCSINDDNTSDTSEVSVDNSISNHVTNSTNFPSHADGLNEHNEGDFWVRNDNNGNAVQAWRFTRENGWVETDLNNIYQKRLNANGTFIKLWETHHNVNNWGDGSYGAIQSAQFMADGTIIGSYAYKGNQSTSRTQGKDIVDTEFKHFNRNGDLLDSMILRGGGHGSSFTYSKTDGLIYAVCRDVGTNAWYIGAINYRPNQIVSVWDMQWRCQIDRFMRPAFDIENNYMLGTYTDGSILVCHIDDLKGGRFTPIIQCRLQDFGITPSGNKGSNGLTNTMQSNGIKYPFAFFTMGDVNNQDTKQILCINLLTQSQEFLYPIEEGSNVLLDVPVTSGGHLEPEGIYYDNDTTSLIVGFNESKYVDNNRTQVVPISTLYSIPLRFRNDVSNNSIDYDVDDSNVSIPIDHAYDPTEEADNYDNEG